MLKSEHTIEPERRPEPPIVAGAASVSGPIIVHLRAPAADFEAFVATEMPIVESFEFDIAPACGGFAIGNDTVWVTGCSEVKRMLAIDPSDNTAVATIELGGYGYYPTIVDGAPWVSLDHGTADNGQIVRIDPLTNEIDRVLAPDVTFSGRGNLVEAGGSVWVSDLPNNTVLRLPLSAFGG